MEKNKKKIIGAIVVAFFVLILFIFYGPISYFRVLWINTAMYTSNHKYLATWLYPEKYIEEVLKESVINTDERTDPSLISVEGGERIIYSELEGNYYKGHILKIQDPSRLELENAGTEKGKLLEEIVAENNAAGGINASGFSDSDNRGLIWGYCIAHSEVVQVCKECNKHTLLAMDRDYKLIVGNFTESEIEDSKEDYLWGVEFGPILIVNGEKTNASSVSGGLAPRTAIGQTERGDILFVVIDGREIESLGATFADLQEILEANGAVNAIGLDGGSSSSLNINGEIINDVIKVEEERLIPNAIIFK